MPTLINKRGKKRYLATTWHQGVRGKTKLMPDATRKSYRLAMAWEKEQTEKMAAEMDQTATDCLTVKKWSDEYLDHCQRRYVRRTYQEKVGSFKRLVDMDQVMSHTPIADIDRYLAAAFLNGQFGERSGHAVNKDRKNMGAAWHWGRDNLAGWPLGENPFLAVSRYPEEKSPRYVPPVEDFWKVYAHVSAIAAAGEDQHVQDRIMLLAYLHLAARRSELFRAKWSDVDFANSQIRLGTRKRKGGYEYDWLPLTVELHKELLSWAQRRLAHSTEDKEHVFVCLSPLPCCDQYYGKPFTQRRWAMGRWCAKAEVKPFGWHAIRHLTANELYKQGCPNQHIQIVLRHRRATTTDLYLRSLGTTEGLRKTLNKGLSCGKVIELNQKKTASGSET